MTPKILQRFLNHCAAYTPAEPWDRVPLPVDVYQPPAADSDVLSDLLISFSTEALVESRLVIDIDGELVLRPALVDSMQPIIALRRVPGLDPFAILTADGVLPGARESWPLAAVLEDHLTQSLISQQNGRLFAVDSMAQVAMLRQCGVPALPLRGALAQLSPAQFDALAAAGRWDLAAAPENVAASQPLELIVMAWDPERLALGWPQELDAVVERLQALAAIGRNVSRVGIWQPKPDEISRLKFLLAHGEVAAAQLIVQHSAQHSLLALEPLHECDELFAAPLTMDFAYAQLVAQLDAHPADFDPQRLERTQRDYRAAVDRITTDVITDALKFTDPWQQLSAIIAANVGGRLLHEMPAIGRMPPGKCASVSDLIKLMKEFRSSFRRLELS